jgi:hypothetical protein
MCRVYIFQVILQGETVAWQPAICVWMRTNNTQLQDTNNVTIGVYIENYICRVYVNVPRRFEKSQSHHLLGQSIKERCTLQGAKSLRQRPQNCGTRAQHGTRKCFQGTRPSVLSLSLSLSHFMYLFCQTSFSILWGEKYIFKIYSKESMYSMFKAKLQNFSLNQLE